MKTNEVFGLFTQRLGHAQQHFCCRLLHEEKDLHAESAPEQVCVPKIRLLLPTGRERREFDTLVANTNQRTQSWRLKGSGNEIPLYAIFMQRRHYIPFAAQMSL
jgi:hypothetical protein